MKILSLFRGVRAVEPSPSASSASAETPDYDPMNTMQALNMAIVSIKNITTAGDRVVLDQEYNSIINNLKIGEIESDPEIISLYTKLMDTISRYRLTDEESRVMTSIYNAHEENAMAAALSKMWPPRGGGLLTILCNLIGSGVTTYFRNQNNLSEIHRQMAQDSWRIREETLTALNDLQTELLRDSWALLRRYHLPDQNRVTQEDLDMYDETLREPDKDIRLRRLSRLRNAFSGLPAYWFNCALTAEACGDREKALEYLGEFDRVWRPVLRRDPYVVEAAKKRISLDSSLSEEQILTLLRKIEINIAPRDWVNNLYCGALVWALGDKERGMDYVRDNIEVYKTETQISRAVLRAMKDNSFLETSFYQSVKAAPMVGRLNENLQSLFAEWLDGDSGTALRLAEDMIAGKYNGTIENGPLPYYAAFFILRRNPAGSPERTRAWGLYSRAVSMKAAENPVYQDVAEVLGVYAEGGSVDALDLLGHMYDYGIGIAENPGKAAEYYKKAANQGHAVAQNNLGDLYYNGEGVGKDLVKAAEYYKKAADQGDANAQFNLGNLYRDGEGVEKDPAKAFEYYKKAADQGNADGQYGLGDLYYSGEGVAEDLVKAAEYYKKAADQGDAVAQNNLGNLYRYGEGVEEDLAKAAEYYKKAADQGDADAQCSLGFLYENGEGVEKDPAKAFEYYKKAADQGNADGQYGLGDLYYSGEGVAEDLVKAAEYYKKAADQGDAVAQCLLGALYSAGEGVTQNYEESYKWLFVAKLNGDEDFEEVRTEIRSSLTWGQTRRAEREAREIYSRQRNNQ